MLLHVVEAPRPIDRAADTVRGGESALEQVSDAVALVHDIPHADAVDDSQVVGLTPGGGVERRRVETGTRRLPPKLRLAERLERAAVRVGIVEALRHAFALCRRNRVQIQNRR